MGEYWRPFLISALDFWCFSSNYPLFISNLLFLERKKKSKKTSKFQTSNICLIQQLKCSNKKKFLLVFFHRWQCILEYQYDSEQRMKQFRYLSFKPIFEQLGWIVPLKSFRAKQSKWNAPQMMCTVMFFTHTPLCSTNQVRYVSAAPVYLNTKTKYLIQFDFILCCVGWNKHLIFFFSISTKFSYSNPRNFVYLLTILKFIRQIGVCQ